MSQNRAAGEPALTTTPTDTQATTPFKYPTTRTNPPRHRRRYPRTTRRGTAPPRLKRDEGRAHDQHGNGRAAGAARGPHATPAPAAPPIHKNQVARPKSAPDHTRHHSRGRGRCASPAEGGNTGGGNAPRVCERRRAGQQAQHKTNQRQPPPPQPKGPRPPHNTRPPTDHGSRPPPAGPATANPSTTPLWTTVTVRGEKRWHEGPDSWGAGGREHLGGLEVHASRWAGYHTPYGGPQQWGGG